MTKKNKPYSKLRAESLLAKEIRDIEALSGNDVKELIQQLNVQRSELEIQKEALRSVRRELETSRQKYFNLFHTAPIGCFTCDENGVIDEVNQTAADQLGTSVSALKHTAFSEYCGTEDRDEFIRHMRLVQSSGTAESCELKLCRSDRTCFYARLDSRVEQEADTDGQRMHVSVTDITRSRLAEKEHRKLSLAIEHSPNMVMITDTEGIIDYINPKYAEVTGYTLEEIKGKTPRILKSGHTTPDVYTELWKTVCDGQVWHGRVKNRKKNGELYWASLTICPVTDGYERITHFIETQEDITESIELSEQLTYQATHDPLTSLINRQEFERRLKRVLNTARSEPCEHVLCYLDLDQFKLVNDACGHQMGDVLLRELAGILLSEIRHRDTLARLGGDEFGLLMEHCPLEEARHVANSIRQSIENYRFKCEEKFSGEEKVFSTGVSIGLVAISDAFMNIDELIMKADAACYAAKDGGRNRVYVHKNEDPMLVQRHGELQWITRINQALEQDDLALMAQTIAPLDRRTGEGVNFEVFVAMKQPDGTCSRAQAFFPVAERYNISPEIDRWVVTTLLRTLSELRVNLKNLHLCFVNLSALSLREDSLAAFIDQQFDKFAIPAGKICFELTETAAISNFNKAVRFIKTLKGSGCQFALDDFGSGFSSFAYLKNLPVDFLKIDGQFIRDITNDSTDLALVKSMNNIAHVMAKKTIAECVEKNETLSLLKKIGVDYAQGYVVAEPCPFSSVICRIGV